jgi:methionyl-tRNA formyltransferase
MAPKAGKDPTAPIGRLVFFGTPAFAVPALEALVAAGRAPARVVTQPPRPAGRKRRLAEPPVAVRARELGLEVDQPDRVRSPEFLERIATLAPDLAVVVAFGQIFPVALLELPARGCLNVHASLLPRWRGAAPIPAAIAAGDPETGVCVQRMDVGLDTGPVLASRATPIGPDETAGELAGRLARLGAELLLETIVALDRGDVTARPQDDAAATWAPKLGGPVALDLARPAPELAREVRAFEPEPGSFLAAGGENLRVRRATAASGTTPASPGELVGIAGSSLCVAAGGGSILALELVQRPGGRPVSGRDYANGRRLGAGDRLA